MQIESWPVDKPTDYPKNARKWTPEAIAKVATSIREFGFVQPVVVDSHGVIIIGHLRRAAARTILLTHIPIHVASKLTPAQVRQLRLMDNRSHAEAEWDQDILTAEMLDLQGLDLDLSLTGFSEMELAAMLTGTATPEWTGMPEFESNDLTPWKTLKVHFEKISDREAFGKLVGQTVTDETRSIWYPRAEIGHYADKRYATPEAVNPVFPVYIISKGRWKSRYTSNALDAMAVPYQIVVEPQERDEYAAVIDPAKIRTLPFSNLGQGSIPARNWVWEDSIQRGAERHWILDDNIKAFYRLHNNLKVQIKTGSTFQAIEDFAERYTNVGLTGMNYFMFASRKSKIAPMTLNTRIYSAILVKNDLPYRWRGRYNEDTDLSIRALKDGWCTILFNAFLAEKMVTMSMKGGNTDELYQDDGRLKMAQSLQAQHPDVVKITRKWNRWQHQVDYRSFKKNKFIPKPGFVVPTEANNYGMELEYLDGK